jgi:hypothetical protein
MKCCRTEHSSTIYVLSLLTGIFWSRLHILTPQYADLLVVAHCLPGDQEGGGDGGVEVGPRNGEEDVGQGHDGEACRYPLPRTDTLIIIRFSTRYLSILILIPIFIIIPLTTMCNYS